MKVGYGEGSVSELYKLFFTAGERGSSRINAAGEKR